MGVTAKVNTAADMNSKEKATIAIEQSLKELDLDNLDLMLMHHPVHLSAEQTVDVWRGLIDATRAGGVRNIGVSNFYLKDIKELASSTGVLPAVSQIEYHPYVKNEGFC